MAHATQMDFYLGAQIRSCYAGYCADANIRKQAAAGGVVSGVLIEMLERKLIEGAVVCRTIGEQGKISADVRIATTPQEVLSCAKSSYWDIPVLDDLDALRRFDGRLALVGLPCQISRLRKMCAKDQALREKICYTVGLFCGGNTQRELLVDVIAQKGIREADVQEILFHRQHVKGGMEIVLKDGARVVIPFQHFNVYRLLHFYAKKRCRYCSDHTAEQADLSVGDIFIAPYKDKPFKYSSIVVRSEAMQRVMDTLIRDEKIVVEPVEQATIFQSQKKSLRYRKNMSARQAAGKFWGLKIPAQTPSAVRWNDYLAAWCYLLNERLFEYARFRKMLFYIPKPLLYAYILVLKSLSNF